MKTEEIDNLKAIFANVLTDEMIVHLDLADDSNKSEMWKRGFIAGIGHVKDNVINQVLDRLINDED